MSEIKLRDYQTECIDAVFAAWAERVRRPAAVLPTGAGKTVVFASLIKGFRAPCAAESLGVGRRVIVLVHRDELADQAINKIHSIAPELSVGKVKAGDNDIEADVMVCSVQTLAVTRRINAVWDAQQIWGDIGLIITDECHHAAAPSYKKIYAAFPDALQLGVTATLARGDNQGLGDVWDDVVYERKITWMMSKGHLVPVKGKALDLKSFNLKDVKRSGGDFQVGSLGKALEESDMAERLPEAYREHAGDRPGVVFTPTVATAEQVTQSFNAAGIRTALISGETPREERQQIFDDYRTGAVQVLANCMVLTEGFDAPWASCAVIARPTQSAPLYTQMVGRVLRPWPGKKDALILNVSGVGHRLASLVDLEPGVVKEVKDGETLDEAIVREAEAAGVQAKRGTIAGDLKFMDVDLFAGSRAAWSQTKKGLLFISTGTALVFLFPEPTEPGKWMVAVLEDEKVKPFPTEHRNLDLGSAMAWGEAVADDYFGGFSVKKSASWRKGRPTDAQLTYASNLGIDVTGLNKGQVSDAINVVKSSQRLDQYA